MTDSFHGMCFAIIFKKPFVVVFNKWQWRGEERIKSLAQFLHLEDRIVSSMEEIEARNLVNTPVDYDSVYKILDAKREECLDYLKAAIEEGKRFTGAWDAYDVMFQNALKTQLQIAELMEENTRQRTAQQEQQHLLEELTTSNLDLKSENQTNLSKISEQSQCIAELSALIESQNARISELNGLILNTRHRTLYGACAWLFRKVFR